MINHQQLIYDVEKRFKTTMIGSLARFEETFGHLWEEEGPDQQEYLERYDIRYKLFTLPTVLWLTSSVFIL
jgi:hypothetical protein